MMHYILTALFFLALFAGPATAGVITLNSGDCAAITTYEPDPDVAYQPGVDAYGKPVAPADINDTGRIDYDTDDIIISIGNPLIALDGVVGDQNAFVAGGGKIDTFGADSNVGDVTFDGNEVLFNGQQITDNEQRALAIACEELQ